MLPADVIADLRAAKIPWVAGMLVRWAPEAGGGEARLLDDAHIREIADALAEDGSLPDPHDRATFLLLCDEAERRGVRGTFYDGEPDRLGRRALLAENIDQLRWAVGWVHPGLRARSIAALARALRETAPGEREQRAALPEATCSHR